VYDLDATSALTSSLDVFMNITWNVTEKWKNDTSYVKTYRLTITDVATGASTSYLSKPVNETDFEVHILLLFVKILHIFRLR